ncbi:hypothetical protein GCM10009624_19190 [Gordonia sinesedis]
MTGGGSQGGGPYGDNPYGVGATGPDQRGGDPAGHRPQAEGAAWGPYNPYGRSSGSGASAAANQNPGAYPAYPTPQPQHAPPAQPQPGYAPPTAQYGGTPTYAGYDASRPATAPVPPVSGGGPLPPGGFGDGGGSSQSPRQRRRSGLTGALVAGALVLGLVAGGIGGVVGAKVSDDNGSSSSSGPLGGDPNSQDTQEVQAPAGSIQEVAARVLPSVVSIDVTAGNEQGEGSGIVLTDDGILLTNNHVVSGSSGRAASDVQVNFNDGSSAAARVLGADRISDIAVLKVDKSGLKPITVGTSKNLAVGQDVIAVGAPLGLEGTVTTGIISALNRPVSTSGPSGSGETSVIDAIQTDAAINPGNSGGALVNARGALIGVNSAIATLGGGGGGSEQQQTGSIGLGFAIPIDQAIRVANELRETGKATHASLGVSVRPTSDPENPGALVSDVQAGGPAAQAGIPSGAIVTKVDDRMIASGDALVAAVRSYAPGDRVSVTYLTNGRTQTTQVTLGTLTS